MTEVNSAELYGAHKNAARELQRAENHVDALRASTIPTKIWATITGKRRAVLENVEAKKQELKKTGETPQYVRNAVQEEANQYLESYRVYEEERNRLTDELSPFHKGVKQEGVEWPGQPSDVGSYIVDLGHLKVPRGTSLTDRAKVMAVVDVFKPKINMPGHAGTTYIIGDWSIGANHEIAVRNGHRFPRFELGADTPEAASQLAGDNGWNQVAKLSASVATNPDKPHLPQRVLARADTYVPVSDATAEVFRWARDSLDSSNSGSVAFGYNAGYLTGTTHHQRFQVDLVQQVEPSV